MITYREPESAAEIFSLAGASFGESPWTLSAFEKELANKWAQYLVMLEDELVIGFASGVLIADELSIGHVAIVQAKQGQGYGYLLLKQWLDNLPVNTRALLEVRAGNIAAQKLYEKIGFTSYYVRKGYYHDPVEDAVMMEYFTVGKDSHDN